MQSTNSKIKALIACLAIGSYATTPLCSAQQAVSDPVATPQAAAVQELPAAPEPQIAYDSSSLAQSQEIASLQEEQKPGQKPAEPSLGDLGFSTAQTKADPKMQALLNKRSHMLKVHQKIGMLTLIPMAATLFTGPSAKGEGRNGQTWKAPSQASLDFHAALGGVTTGMYFTTAYYAMFAPKIPGTHHKGPIRLHEALAFIHAPGMIATPILGMMAYNQENNGEKVHGIASAHGAVAAVTITAYAASILAVSWPPKFWHHKSQ